jgi:glyoxylase-like metal-dependent hydrolase (beta-lactamase superfamily II)
MPVRAVHTFHCGTIAMLRGLHTGGVGWIEGVMPCVVPFLCFAIQLEDGSWILVDGGVDRDAEPGWMKHALGYAFRLRFDDDCRHGARLERLGITPDKVRAYVVTHLDYDHTAGLRAFPDLPVYISHAEWAYGSAPPVLDRLIGRQNRADYAGLRNVRPLDLAPDAALPHVDGAAAIPEGGGDVTLVSLPGHTPGHAGVLVRLASGERMLLCGDSCVSSEHITNAAHPLSFFVRAVSLDYGRTLKTIAGMRRWRADEPALRIVPSHDPQVGALCTAGPARIG